MFRLIIIVLLAVAGACAAEGKLSIVTCMVKPQLLFFENEIIEPYARENHLTIEVINIPEIEDIEGFLRKRKNAALCMVPFGKAWSFVDKEIVQAVTPALSEQEERVFNEEYILTWLGKKGNDQYFLPRKYETRIMVYRKSKVAAALDVWKTGESLRDSVNSLVGKVNGTGLPRGYALEADPAEWDFFDVLVIGMVWKSMSGSKMAGRIGHRAKHYSGTALRIIDRVYQCGGDSLTMLAMNGDAVIDAFTWEAVYASFGVYNSDMMKNRWSGSDLWAEFAHELIYLSFLTQIDCFFVHGNGDVRMAGALQSPQDLGFATMPKGCSIECRKDSTLKRTGTKAITNGGWWWAVPASCKDVRRSFKLFEHITSRENQLRECPTFGMIPVRSDVLKNDLLLVKSGWISDVFRTSYMQVKINNNFVVPAQGEFDAVSTLYLDAWKAIVCGGKWGEKRKNFPDRDFIGNYLGERYVSRANKIFEENR